ncbi:Serine/threonine-protein kinase OXI1 [Cardamine amara subsp. amara]|uniref:non-specific serine/threonine protein kinase n=1 Tax=Cardamine amara subsp. amara TaxID=228776 RepID=A0ABD1BLC8_CARAN
MRREGDEKTSRTLDFNQLEVLSLLGRGAKGVVFLVRDNESKLLALKVILREAIEKKKKAEDEYKRVSFEQGVLSRFDHPLFPSLHGVLATDKVIGYAIDYCPGRNLNSLRKMQTENMFSDEIIRFYAAELVIAFEYLHNQGIVYRDLKPENVMIQENGHLMLIDFDLSTNLAPRTPQPSPSYSKASSETMRKKRLFSFGSFCNSGISPEESTSICSSSSTTSTLDSSGEKSNSFVGTEEYVAPEIITGGGHDFAVDWWSLGVVLYEMLYGTTPFRGLNRKETFFRIISKPPNLIGEATSLRDLIRRLLEKDPSRRINVEEIKGHDFFRGVDWDNVLLVSRPPYIPPPDDEDVKGKDENTKMDVENIVHEIFTAREERDKQSGDNSNNVDMKVKGEKGGEWVKGLNTNNHLESDNNFLVF